MRGNFLSSAVLNALPGGLSTAAVLLAAAWYGERAGLSLEQTATVGTILIGLAGVLVLLRLCWPLNRRRSALLLGVGVLFAAAVTAFGFMMHIVPLGQTAARLALALAAALPVLFGALSAVCGLAKQKLAVKEE